MTLLETIAADAAAYFAPETGFAEAATLTNPGSVGSSLPVIFVEPFSTLNEFGQPAANASPAALLRDTEATGAVAGSTLTIGPKTWRVIAVEPDGNGITRLVLSESATHGAQQ